MRRQPSYWQFLKWALLYAVPALLLGCAISSIGMAVSSALIFLVTEPNDWLPAAGASMLAVQLYFAGAFVLGLLPTLLVGAPMYAWWSYRFGPNLFGALLIAMLPLILWPIDALLNDAPMTANSESFRPFFFAPLFAAYGIAVAISLHYLLRRRFTRMMTLQDADASSDPNVVGR